MTDVNRSSIVLNLTDVRSKFLKTKLEAKLYNRRLASLNQRFDGSIRGKPFPLDDIPAAPTGLAELFMNPIGYRYKSIFINVPSGRPLPVEETFFLDPGTAIPTFPTFTEISSSQSWKPFSDVLERSGISSATEWKKLSDKQRAGLFNLFAKAGKEKVDGESIWSFVNEITEFHPERVFATVRPELLAQLRNQPERFRTVSGAMHKFPKGWKAVRDKGSFKTCDDAGNLQVTFARKLDQYLADIDIDDHAGAEHVADVLKHALTGKDTDPYDIHQILLFFQQLDPGYELAPGS